ncbi:MAG: bifunctional 5,10-methylenetetrahydrofolate dehydrogenase/5,10-methenyltetrahydrofolate cyclohydrolase [Acidimicrobiales bacterium]|nr:bifunctional 5,10-methylenetetrahydrofolate dehydrogenase/5,10-methenyltetrahydrofolate cyclohydrolase [Acidimicrobiales bacterium]
MPDSPTAELMDGVALARRVLAETADRAVAFVASAGRPPCLAAVLVGDDPASVTYVKMKRARSRAAGVESRLVAIPPTARTSEVVDAVDELSADATVDGILVQHPVPSQVDERAVFEAIAPAKDVDGVTARSFAAMALALPGFPSCTAAGIMRLLDAYGVDLPGRHAVVIGRSPILGKPIGMLLLVRDATVTYCHSHTRDLAAIVATADIVIAAAGKPNFVRGAWIKPGAVVVDAGYNPDNIGDVAFDEVAATARLVTPVPGGVGPMTIALLIEHTVTAAEQRHGLRSLRPPT